MTNQMNERARQNRRLFALSAQASTAALITFAIFASPAFAQTTPTGGDGRAKATGTETSDIAATEQYAADIVVSGSRIVRDGYNSPTPTTVVGQELLLARAPTTIINALATLPEFKQSSSPSTSTNPVGGSNGQSFANLRGLGANRTLVLIDGQRVVPSTATGQVDIALMPAALIQRIDVVTGGASAAFGSDAVAGVVNFVLDTGYRGIKGEIQRGIADRGDAAMGKYSLTIGHQFGEKLSVLLSAEYYKMAGVFPLQRATTATNLISNPAYVVGNGQYRLAIRPFVYQSNATFGGLILNGPLAGNQFAPDGSLSRQIPGTFVGPQTYALAGQTDLPFIARTNYFSDPQERLVGFGRVSYNLTDDLKIYADAQYAKSKTSQTSSEPNTNLIGALTIFSANPFLPVGVRNTLLAANVSSFTMGRNSRDLGTPIVTRDNTMQRYTVGVKGDLGSRWKIDAYFTHGENHSNFQIQNNLITALFREAVDAVSGPGGSIVCRSTLTNPTNGCAPLNLFGEQASFTAAQRAYIFGTTQSILDFKQDAAAVSISGTPFNTWAGPVAVAVGGEYRRDRAVQTVDALSQASRFQLGNPKFLSGNVTVKEAFAEVAVPLLSDSPLGHKLELNAAGRITDYSTSGTVTSWKAGLSYEPFSDLRFRATRSRDIRAPNISELFSSTVQTSATIIDPVLGGQALVQLLSRGNPALKAEKADTFAGGAVYKASWLPGLSGSVDYYQIEVNGAIATLTAQDIANRCASGEIALCTLVQRDTTNRIVSITNQFINLSSIQTRGIDMELTYQTPLQNIGIRVPGNISLRAIGSHLLKYTTNDGLRTLDTTGSLLVGQPKWSWTFLAGYTSDTLSGFVTLTRIGGGNYDTTLTGAFDLSPEDRNIPSKLYTDLALRYKLPAAGGKIELFMNADNVFDVKPPAVFAFPAAGPNYDYVGRYFKFGASFAF